METEITRGEYRQVAGFDKVHVKGIGELILTQGEKEELYIDANPDLLPQIKQK